MLKTSKALMLILAGTSAAGCTPVKEPRLDGSIKRAGIAAASQALATGDCRLMAIKSHFINVPGAPEDEMEKRNNGLASLRYFNGPHLLRLETTEDEELNKMGFVYAEAYNGHIVMQRERVSCSPPAPDQAAP